MKLSSYRRLVSPLAVLSLALVSQTADAQVRYVRASPPDDARYPVEVEVHVAFGADNVYGNTGFGAGVRASVPLVAGWLGRNVSDNLAISFGGDVINYDNCYYSGRCGADYLMLPLAAQWNVFFGEHVSVFGEGGLFVYKGFFTGCGDGLSGCGAPSDLGVLPTLALGLRVRVARYVALVLRLGYPTSTLGVSFL